eukprot:g28260.t1
MFRVEARELQHPEVIHRLVVEFINRAHKIVQDITQAQHNAICALKTNRNIVIKPAEKEGAIVIQNRRLLQRGNLQLLSRHYRFPFRLALYTSIPYNDGIDATASVLNTTNCQFPDAIPQLIRFILNHNVFTFDNQLFIQNRTAMRARFAPYYANIFMHKLGQDFFAAQNLCPMLYTRYNDNIFYFPGAGKLHHVLYSLQHVIDDNKHLAKIIPTPPLLTFKQPPNLRPSLTANNPDFRT